jgi:hypothetical protein
LYGLGRINGKEKRIEIGIDMRKLDVAKRLLEHGMRIGIAVSDALFLLFFFIFVT